MINLFVIVCVCFGSIISFKHALHMFQQNRYEVGRYLDWIKDNLKQHNLINTINVLFMVLLVFVILANTNVSKIVLCIVGIVCGVVSLISEKKKSYIKPLVYTSRVKRQIVCAIILKVLFVSLFVYNNWLVMGVISLWFGSWLLVFLIAYITMPIEWMVRNYYLNDAKKILRNDTNLIKIGITGSYGKTSTKNIIQTMVSEQFNSLMTPASYNTPMGITRTIREYLKPIHQVFVCEMGADHVGDIKELMEFVQPTMGIVTSIGPQHLATFGSQENITKEKMNMIEMLPEDGFGVLNYDNEFIRNWTLKNKVECVSYGIQCEDVDYRAIDIEYSNTGSKFKVVHSDEVIEIETKLLGELNILNILSAIAICRHLCVSWKVIQRACKMMKPVEHRLEPKLINGYRFIDDAFNANPSGSLNALKVMSMMSGKRVIVTPGMIDLGVKQDEINYQFGCNMKGRVDVVILVGKHQTQPIYNGLKDSGFNMDNVLVVDHVQEGFAYVYQNCSKEDVILLENDLPDAFNH